MKKWTLTGAVLVLVVIVVVWFLRPADIETGEAPAPIGGTPADVIEHGRALVNLANCQPCHTARGGAPFAGGRAIPTPFGVFYAPNITPDVETGIGAWSAEDFWRALHNGRSRDGRLLYPTFPYTNYTKISRSDALAMFEYLKTLPPVRQESRDHELRFPYNQRALLVAWRRLFFRPGVYQPDPSQSAEWNRGAYLVQGVAHCSACHEARNALGAIQSRSNPAGGLVLNWYAPALNSSREAGLGHWSEENIVSLLKTGRTVPDAPPDMRASTIGPMAEVVFESLQHADPSELHAMAVYLKSLPDAQPGDEPRRMRMSAASALTENGRKVYADHCARCHGDNGEGQLPAGPALAGNRAVTMANATNPIRIVLYGGYTPGTSGNPRPFGMPPFAQTLSDQEIAAVVSYMRTSWNNRGAPVSAAEVARNRTGPLW